MSTLDALRQAVLASPDDDLPRLVFADYLEENGDPDRAAFIRAQIEMAKTPEYEPFAVLCKTRKREWLTGVPWYRTLIERTPAGAHWKGTELRDGEWHGSPFRRGFGWAVSAAATPRSASGIAELLTREPVGEIHLGTATLDQWREFTDSPWLSRIRTVVIGGLSSPNEPLLCLRESPNTTGITSLKLEHTNQPSMPFILEPLFNTPLGHQLTALSMRLGRSNDFDESLDAIARPETQLVEYDFYRMGFGPAAARVFVDGSLAEQAEILRLQGNPLLVSGLTILAKAASRLRILDLTDATLDQTAADVLSQSPTFGSLRKLVLTSNKLGTDAIKAIARSPHLAGLRSVVMERTGCDNAALRYLTRGTFWPNLVELDLRRNDISDVGMKHLLTARPAPDLTSLVLPTRNLTNDMRAELQAKFGEVMSWAD